MRSDTLVVMGLAGLALGAALFLAPGPEASRHTARTPSPGNEMRWPLEEKLASTDPRLRLPELLERLRARGFQPRVISTWRSLATQAALVEQGLSKVPFSFHNALRPDGRPGALAGDIVDARWWWGDGVVGSPKTAGAASFFLALGEEAKKLGLHWGGDWKHSNAIWAAYGMGWDPAHVQALDNHHLASIEAITRRAAAAA